MRTASQHEVVPPQDLDSALQFGPGIRVQRLVESAFMIAAVFSQDLRFASVTFVLTLLQTLSPRWLPIARAVTAVVVIRPGHRIGDLYFDLGGVRGAAAISLVVQGAGIGLVLAGHSMSGFLLLVLPTASFLMAPTLGFCSGCWFYVLGREWMARRGWVKKEFDNAGDIAIARDDGTD